MKLRGKKYKDEKEWDSEREREREREREIERMEVVSESE